VPFGSESGTLSGVDDRYFCACDPGFASYACQMPIKSLPLNDNDPTVVTVPAGEWSYWEVLLPPSASFGGLGPPVTVGGTSGVSDAGGGLGPGVTPGLGGNAALMLTAERVPGPGHGGNGLIFMKPFTAKV
jgi:hypothetical protein